MIAGMDTFKDENYLFMSRLIENGVDVKCKEHRLMPHGFYSYILPMGYGMPESMEAVGHAYLSFKELL